LHPPLNPLPSREGKGIEKLPSNKKKGGGTSIEGGGRGILPLQGGESTHFKWEGNKVTVHGSKVPRLQRDSKVVLLSP